MKEKLNILVKFNEWTQGGNPVKRIIAQIWRKLVLEAQYRLSGSFSFSVVIHLFIILGYFGLGALDQPSEPPIREITFIDMNEIKEEPEEVITKKYRPPVVKLDVPPLLPEEQQVQSQVAQQQTSPSLALGKDRIFLDSPRKQAPINVNEYEPVAGEVNQPKDILGISPAIGIKKDEHTSKPASLDLGNESDMLIASASPSNAVSFGQTGKPQIDLNVAQGPVSTGPVSNQIAPSKPKPVKTEPELKPKETQTLITGDLANREIVDRVIPRFPYWAKSKGVGATISLRFTVMQNGIVKETVIVERTSGSLQWDQMVISALKKWKFVPLKSGGLRQDQNGVITFQFVI
jgi:TonB family protein